MSDKEKQLAAAERMSQLATALEEASHLIKMHALNGGDIEIAYGIAYNLRKELGYVVATLGFGVPRKTRQSP